MSHTGSAYLPLHGGWAPKWLIKRMEALARSIVLIMVEEFGRNEFLRRLSDPYWFQALGCTLGFDWHSSGVTTVVTGVLKSAVDPQETGLAVCGGKGRRSRETPAEIRAMGEKFGLSSSKIDQLIYASRMGAKVDNTAIQAGYQLYHHAFIISEDGRWCIVQQGMRPENRLARRYHWLSESVVSFVVEPHKAVVGHRENRALNMTAKEAEECRKTSVDIVNDDLMKIKTELITIKETKQKSLLDYMDGRVLVMPWKINWRALEAAYNLRPRNYEELLGIEGIGPATVRGLALISDLIYGAPPSWKDPVRYSFAFGGKDGVPFPVQRKEMDEAIEFLRIAVEQAKINEKERLNALRRLRAFSSPNR
ncbi:MAG: DUF763 domain-containing protein [Candidatus Methanomethyliaceae archaeon]|nr:DUF763 domain-containing protein [Candidatus Methanomethyliaceae archaeon]